MNKLIKLLLVCLMAVAFVNADCGVDFDSDTVNSVGGDSSTWSCIAGANDRVILQVWSGGYGFTSGIAAAVAGAQAAGISTIDLYAFLCNQCSGNSPSSSAIQSIVSQLSGVSYNMLWIDVEQCSGCWSDDSDNAAFVQEAVETAQSLGVNVGVYSSVGEWGQTVGNFTGVSNVPLWYAHYDGVPAFSDNSDFEFGGWSNPTMKQYDGNANQCGISVDLNFWGSGTCGSSSGSGSSSGTASASSSTTSSGSGSGSSTSGSGSSSGSGSTSGSGSSSGSGSTSGSGSSSGSGSTSGSGSSSGSGSQTNTKYL